MRRLGLAAVYVLLAGTLLTRAEGPSDPKVIVDRAIEALGGRERLTKFKAARWKGNGTYFGLGKGTRYTGVWQVQPPDRARIIIEGELDGRTFQRTVVVSGDHGWIKVDHAAETMSKEALAEEKETLYANWVACVVPLLDSSFELIPLGMERINGRRAAGIKVTRAGNRDVKLFFDEESGLPAKSEIKTRDLQTGKDALHEVYYYEYRDFHGVRRPRKTTIKWDGVIVAEGEIEEFKPSLGLPSATFSKP